MGLRGSGSWVNFSGALAGAALLAVPSSAAVVPSAAVGDSSFSVKVAADSAVPLRAGSPGQTVMGTLTVLEPAAAGHTRVYPCAGGRPDASSSNYVAGVPASNFVAVKTDANGFICFYSSATVHLTWDQELETTAVAAHQPTRRVNTPATGAPLAANAVLRVRAGAPRQTIIGNLTVVRAEGNGSVTAYPCADGRPTSVTTTFKVGQTVAAGVMVPADVNGDVCLATTANTHLTWDQSAETSLLKTTKPVRKLDTRSGKLPPAGSVVKVKAATGRQTVAGTVTSMLSGAAGAVTAYPCADGRPATTDLVFAAGQTTSGFTLVPADAKGEVCFYTTAPTHLLWDQVLTTTAVTAHKATRILDTRPRPATGPYAVALTSGGAPVRWNPCVPALRVYVNWGTQAAEKANLQTAITRVSDATGIPIVVQGTTAVVPRTGNSYGVRGAPATADVIVAFSQPGATDLLTGKEYGVGGYLTDAKGAVIRKGFVLVDQKQLAKQTANQRIAMYMHEWGHVMGLQHPSSDPTQVMYGGMHAGNSTGIWGNGDVVGLRRVGLGSGCLQ